MITTELNTPKGAAMGVIAGMLYEAAVMLEVEAQKLVESIRVLDAKG